MQNEQTPAVGPLLLPCPFCGSESVSRDSTAYTDAADYIWFKCDGCGVESEGEHGRDAALAQWNRRPHVASPASSSSVVQGDASGVEREPITHDVKCWPEPFAAVKSGAKPWELRINDRDYSTGDTLIQREWSPDAKGYTGEQTAHRIGWMLHGPAFGLPDGYVIMTLEALRPQPSGETREVVLKGVGKITGDGWKDTTTEGEIVFVWNAEKPSPYAPGQYPRVGNEGWSASTSQYDFAPATADDIPAIIALLRPAAPDAGGGFNPTHRHVKRGTTYQVLGEARLQQASQFGPVEGDSITFYRGEDGQLWARATSEFEDGRFSALQPGGKR